MPLLKAVILIAGPQKGTRFRPLSLDVPKPLFPVAGLPIVQHHIEACVKVKDLKEILILGFYPSSEMSTFVTEMNKLFKVNIRYLQEFAPLGTAGGIYHFRDQIRAGNPDAFFVMNGDVCADFPLEDMLVFHQGKENTMATILGTEATRQQSVNYGCIVEDKDTHSVLHYVEKPNSYISTMINCGVYIFSPEIFPMLQNVFNAKQTEYLSSMESEDSCKRETIWLERDLIVPLAGTNTAYLYQTTNWWSQIKTAGSAIYANRHYLALYNKTNNERLTKEDKNTPKIIGDVFIHESATVDPSAVLGPNVSIGKNVKIGAGARIRESIILGNSHIGENTLVLYSVIGWNSSVGNWSRVEGTPDDPNPNKPFAKMENNPLFNVSGQLNPSITILGSNVVVPSEVMLLNSIVLPHKELGDILSMSSAPPPHPGSAWQQCHDQTSGYPYYWNTTTNQVRWDCPLEFRQWQTSLARPPPVSLPPPKLVTDVKLATVIQSEARSKSTSPKPTSLVATPAATAPAQSTAKPAPASALVSGYGTDSEDEEDKTSQHSETGLSGNVEDAEKVEAQPNFIGPVIPKPSEDTEKDKNDADIPTEQSEPPPPGSDLEESDVSLLKKLKEKSEALAQMGGEIENNVKEIIDPENIAKMESELADDILSQIEAEKPPDYLEQKPLFPSAASLSTQPPLPPQPPSKPLPRRPLQPSSMLQLACNYGHESDSDTEEDPTPTKKNVSSKLLPVTGHLDSLGRMVFDQGDSASGWQTEEQREALESYKAQSVPETKLNGRDESHSRDKFETASSGSRKRRLALPGGRFNKTDQNEEKSKSDAMVEFKPTMTFIKSSVGVPGTMPEAEKEKNNETVNRTNGEKESVSEQPDVATQATELVEKLEYFKVGEEKVSSLKTLAIKLETLYSAWAAGALSLPYLNIVLQNAKKKIEEAEKNLETAPWKAVWDRDKRTYTFRNESNGKEKNARDASLSPSSHTPPPLPPESQVLPPLPPPEAPLPAPPPSADHQLQDMDIDDEPTVNITDEISNFYLQMQETDPTFPVDETEKPEDDVLSQPSAPNSAPSSPAPPEIKKRKKVKVSNNISLKKKGVGDMLAKWQKINN